MNLDKDTSITDIYNNTKIPFGSFPFLKII